MVGWHWPLSNTVVSITWALKARLLAPHQPATGAVAGEGRGRARRRHISYIRRHVYTCVYNLISLDLTHCLVMLGSWRHALLVKWGTGIAGGVSFRMQAPCGDAARSEVVAATDALFLCQ